MMESFENLESSNLEGTDNLSDASPRSIDQLNDAEREYLNEVKDNPEAYSSRMEELGIANCETESEGVDSALTDMISEKDFQENFDDNLPSLEEIQENIETSRELSLEELREVRPDLADYVESMQERLGHNDYAQSIKAYYCENGDIILAGTDNRTRQESNYAVVRGNDIYCWAGNARCDGHLNEFANNTDGYVPNSRYHFENATYVTNDMGQVETVYEYHITSRATDRNEERGELKSVCDAKGGLSDDVGGHIVAHNIDGVTEAINIVPMNDSFNNGGEWKSMEEVFLTEYSEGRSFAVRKEIHYNQETGRPDHIDVKACIQGEKMNWSYDLP